MRFELFISTEGSLRTIRQLTNFRLYELTNVCEGVTGNQAENVRKHFATPAGFLHRRWKILKDVRVNILITVGPLYIDHLGLGDRNKWPLSRGRRCSQCMDVLSAGTKKVTVVERRQLGSTVLFSLWLLRNRVTRHGYKKRGRRGWGNVSKITQIVLTQLGLIQDFWLGGSKLWFRKDCWTFLWQITSPHTPSHQPRCTL